MILSNRGWDRIQYNNMICTHLLSISSPWNHLFIYALTFQTQQANYHTLQHCATIIVLSMFH